MVPALKEPTRSYIDGTPTQRRLGFVAASIFSATYVIAPVYLLVTGVTLVRAKRPLSKDVWLLTLPLIASALLPAKLLPKFGRWLLQTKFMACVPYYFEYEEFHVRSPRFEVSRCLHTIGARRLQEVVGGFFFDFEAVRTKSRDRDAPRRYTARSRTGSLLRGVPMTEN